MNLLHKDRLKYRETLLVIVLGFSVLYFVLDKNWMLITALAVGISGMLSIHLNRLIHLGWFFIGEKMGFVVSKVVLGAVFIAVLLPMGLLSRLFRKDFMNLHSPDKSGYHSRYHLYQPDDFENMW